MDRDCPVGNKLLLVVPEVYARSCMLEHNYRSDSKIVCSSSLAVSIDVDW